MKVLSIVGTRPEAIKMAPVIKELAKRRGIVSKVCVTGQHREMLDPVLRLFGVASDYDLDLMVADQSLAQLTARILTGMDRILAEERFDCVLVQGDTTTCMAAGLCAFYHRIPIAHVEAGLRTGDKYQPFPEEINRRMTDAASDLFFAPTPWARDNLLRENVQAERIVVTGNTVVDALLWVRGQDFDMDSSPLAGLPQDKRLILLTAHRRENQGQPLRDICAAVQRLVKDFADIHVVYPVHLNPNIRGPVSELLGGNPAITLLPPLDYLPLVKLMDRAYLVLTDSGGIQEEAPSLGKPVLVLRNTTERPEGVDAGTVRLVGNDREGIYNAAAHLLTDRNAYRDMSLTANPYGDGRSAEAIVDVLMREFSD